MTSRPPIDPALGDAFSVRDARGAGVTASRLRAGDLISEFSGSRIRTPPLTGLDGLLRLCTAYVPVAPARWAFSHATAARLYRMPLPSSLEGGELHVAVPTGCPAPRRSGVVGHRLTGVTPGVAHGFPTIEPERVWLQLAPLLSLDELVVAGDFLVRRKRPLSSAGALERAVELSAGARGRTRAALALGGIRAGTDSPPESWTRLALTRAGLPEPLVGHTVFDEGYFVGTPDLAYPAERIAIEYEGEGHRTDARVFEDDIDRRELFRRAGWLVIQVTGRKLRNRSALLSEVSDALRERRAPR